MDALKTYDYLVRARQRIFDWTRPLTAAQYAQPCPPWTRSLGQTLTHIYSSEWYYIQRMTGADVPPYESWPIREENMPPFGKLEAVWKEQAAKTRGELGAVRNWSLPLEYRITDDDGKPKIITASAADIFTQLALHEVHHRSQAMGMLKAFGATLQDLDYNTMMYARRDP